METLLVCFAFNGLIVAQFTLKAKTGEPGNRVEEPEENGRIFAELTFEGGWVEAIEQLTDVGSDEGKGRLVDFAGLILPDEIGESFVPVPHLLEPILML